MGGISSLRPRERRATCQVGSQESCLCYLPDASKSHFTVESTGAQEADTQVAESGSNPGSPDPGTATPQASRRFRKPSAVQLSHFPRQIQQLSEQTWWKPRLNPPRWFLHRGLWLFLLPGALLPQRPGAGSSQPTTLSERATLQPHAFWDITLF